MIYSVNGILEEVEPYHIVIECGGIGYSVRTSMTTISALPHAGERVKVYTYLYVREDILELYGFVERSELNAFKMLISVSGVGPKAAISILSGLTPERFALCVASGDAKSLRVPGVGPKIAQRIVLELKDKVAKEQIASGAVGDTVMDAAVKTGNASEAISALEVLGYSRAEATQIVTKFDSDMSVEDMIKNGLKALAGKV